MTTQVRNSELVNLLKADFIPWSVAVTGLPPAAHNLLSASHGDTTTQAVSRGSIITGQGALPTWNELTIDVANKYLRSDGVDAAWGDAVYSAALSMPAQFAVAGSPITTSGTFTVTWANQNANLVFAGPAAAPAAAPTFRALVANDVPNHDSLNGFVANEHIDHTSVTFTAGNGLTGGGDISASRTFNVGAGTGIAVGADDVSLSHLGLEALADPGADRVFFWDESANAAAWLSCGSGPVISLTTLDVDHDACTNFVADEHVAHSGVSINAGNGLTGGGDITASRTLNVAAADTSITINADSIQLPTPGTLSVSSVNAAAAPHTHAITSSSNPGAVESLLASAADGGLQLIRFGIGIDPNTDSGIMMADDAWIGLGAAAGRLVFNSTPAPDQIAVTAADVYFATTAHGIIHIDGNAAGSYLRADGTRYVPSTIQINDVPSISGLFLALLGLRGFWPTSSFDESGNAYDLSGQGRTLTYNGNPTYNFSGLVPYLDFDGTGDFLSRADEAGLDILGTESYVAAAAQGLTVGGWFWCDTFPGIGTIDGFITKNLSTGNQRSFRLQVNNATIISFRVSGDGVSTINADSAAGMFSGTWYFLAGRFVPSTSVDLYVNDTKYTNAAGVPAAIFNSSADLDVGANENGASGFLDGRASLCFLCATALSDTIIDSLFQKTRGFFGV